MRDRLDTNNGQLYTNGKISAGTYDFSVKVYDRVHHKDVVSSVTVVVQEIGDDAVYNSGSLRLTGERELRMCASDTITPSKVCV